MLYCKVCGCSNTQGIYKVRNGKFIERLCSANSMQAKQIHIPGV